MPIAEALASTTFFNPCMQCLFGKIPTFRTSIGMNNDTEVRGPLTEEAAGARWCITLTSQNLEKAVLVLRAFQI